MANHTGRTRSAFRACLLLQLLVLSAVYACTSEEKLETSQQSPSSGFTFFGVHQDTAFDKSLRERLVDTLSSDAVEYRSIINLEVVESGFLRQHFPLLDELNRRLNTPPGERIEYPTIRLMYRWAARKDLPFSYVELLFSDDMRKPLYIKIESILDIEDIFDTLQEKYGEPTLLKLDGGDANIRYWEDNRSVFLAAKLFRRNERPQYRMMIYFTDNLESFILAQEKKRRDQEEKKKQEGRSAF